MESITTTVSFTILGTCNDARLDHIKEVIRQIPTSSEPEFTTTYVPKEFDKGKNGEVWDMISEGARFCWLEKEASKHGYIQSQSKIFASRSFIQLPAAIQQIILTT